MDGEALRNISKSIWNEVISEVWRVKKFIV